MQYILFGNLIRFAPCALLVLMISGCSRESKLSKAEAEAAAEKRNDYLLRKCQPGDSICGYVNKKGRTVIEQGKYAICSTDTFRQVAVVFKEGEGCVAIDRSERILYHVLPFDNGCDYSSPSEGLFRIRHNGKVGFANLDGEIVIQPGYDFAQPFSDGYAVFCQDCKPEKDGEHYAVVGGRWGFIDRNGQMLFGDDFEEAASFSDGMARVKRNGRTFFIDVNGHELKE